MNQSNLFLRKCNNIGQDKSRDIGEDHIINSCLTVVTFAITDDLIEMALKLSIR